MADSTEHVVREALAAGRTAEAVVVALDAHGAGVLGYFVERLRSVHRAQELYAQFQEDLVRGLATFEGRCALKTWLFAVARRRLARSARDEGRRRKRERSWDSRLGEQLSVADRDETPAFRRTTMKDRVRELRSHLDDDEQLLLFLRVDQDMPWLEIAVALHPDEAFENDDARARVAARLRRRFADLTIRLRRLAETEGLLDGLG